MAEEALKNVRAVEVVLVLAWQEVAVTNRNYKVTMMENAEVKVRT